jgi:hypothetical protein
MTTILLTSSQDYQQTVCDEASVLPSPSRRTILLSGDARVHRSTYHMEGTLFAAEAGDLHGEILWTNVDNPGFPKGMAGTELVRGAATPTELHFAGYQIDRPFIKERYRLVLVGTAEAGVFSGVSEAYGVWDARLSGNYHIVFERGN